MEECGIAQGIWPKAQSALPAASEHERAAIACACSQEVVDGVLGNAILEVSVYATEGELLALLMASLFECIVGKPTIVAVVMLNFYAMLSGEGLKGAFGSNGFG